MLNFAKLSIYTPKNMAKEIERKFLVKNSTFRELSTTAICMKQGYLSRLPEATVRVRIAGDKAFLTVKGKNDGAVRDEWEYSIPVADAEGMLERCAQGSVISKTRYIVPEGAYNWEVDEFHGSHEGLVVAEIELPHPDATFGRPDFIGEEVTGNPSYYNSNL